MEREVSCINTIAIMEYAKAHGIDTSALVDGLDPEINSLNDPTVFLMDSANWVSTSITVKLFERLKSILQDDNVPYKIAEFALKNSLPGNRQLIFIKAFLSFKNAMNHIQEINDQWNRSKTVELVELKTQKAVIRLHWHSNTKLSKDLCIFNQGYYRFSPCVWGGKPLILYEKCCFFEGAAYCEYHMRFPLLNRFHEMWSRFFSSKNVLTETIKEMEADKLVIEKQYGEVNRLNKEFRQKMKQFLAIQDIEKAMLSALNLEELLAVIMDTLVNVCRIYRAIIMLVNEEKECLEYIYGRGVGGEIPDEIKYYSVSLHRTDHILIRVLTSGCAEYVGDVTESNREKENIILPDAKSRSIYAVPLIAQSMVIGVIAIDGVDEKGIPKETRDTFEIFAPQIAIAIESARLYRNLQEQVQELKQSHAKLSSAEKFSLLANLAEKLAYEIQHPMTEIETFIKLLPARFNDGDFRNKMYLTALEETNRVNRLISELLDLAKMEDSRFGYNDIHDLIDKMVLLVSPQSNVKNIQVIRQFDPSIGYIWLDPDKMKQVILNILSYALEFTPENGRIDIQTKGDCKSGNERSIRIEIKDDGVGIPKSQIDNIFDPFYTTKPKSNMKNSTGLGLFIAHKNIQEHGGSIEVKSRFQEGTTFFITLPLSSPEGL